MSTSPAEPTSAAADSSDGAVALEQAFARYQGEILGTLYYLVGNQEDARDALQETFIKCWRHRDQVDLIQNLRAWIFRIALNTGRDLRSNAWRRRRQGLSGEESMIESAAAGPASCAEHREDLQRIRHALQNLRPEEQEVFLLRQNGQLTYDEIAVTVGLPTGTVKTRMRLALSKLREALSEQ